jgi:penicillin-binding protein 2
VRKKTKFAVLRVTVIFAFALLAGRLWYVQVVMGSYYKQQGDTSKIRRLPVQALRGIIYDRNGKQLVDNAPKWAVSIVPKGIPATGATAIYQRLSALLGGNPSARQIARVVAANEWRAFAPIVIKPDISIQKAMVIMQLHVELPGVEAVPTSIRSYRNDPQFSLAHVVGYTGVVNPTTYAADRRLYPAEKFGQNDYVGQSGVELSLDQYLHGVNGIKEVEVDAGERPVRTIRRARTVVGDDAYLTIDSRLQREVSNDLAAALNHLNAVNGAHLWQAVAIVEDVHSGAILAMVSLPSFNNDWFSRGITASQFAALENNINHPLLDYATEGQYPPGSTYKIITAAAALQTGAVTPSTVVDDTGAIAVSGHTFHGWKPGGLGIMNMESAISHSSDIYFYTVAGGDPSNGRACPPTPCIGPNRLAHWAKMFGLGSQVGLNLPGETPGLVPSPSWFLRQPYPLRNPGDRWYIGQTYNMAIGQGFNEATPLQMVNVAATIANGGTIYRPQVVDHVTGRVVPRGRVLKKPAIIQPFIPSILRQNFLSPSTVSLIQQGMHDSVQLPNWEGTSYLAQDPRIDAAGKTGTAEDTTGDGTPDAWWVGYAPFNHPKIAITVLVPHANAEGAYVSAPIGHKIFEDYFHLKPFLPDKPPTDTNWLDDVTQQTVGGGGSQ